MIYSDLLLIFFITKWFEVQPFRVKIIIKLFEIKSYELIHNS